MEIKWLTREPVKQNRDFWEPVFFFEKRPTLSHFNVISWRGSFLCFPAPCFSNYCCPLHPQDFIAFKMVECSFPRQHGRASGVLRTCLTAHEHLWRFSRKNRCWEAKGRPSSLHPRATAESFPVRQGDAQIQRELPEQRVFSWWFWI